MQLAAVQRLTSCLQRPEHDIPVAYAHAYTSKFAAAESETESDDEALSGLPPRTLADRVLLQKALDELKRR